MLRRQFLATASAVAISVTVLAQAGLARTPDDQLVIAVNMSSMRGMDPHELNQLEAAEVVANLYDRLITFAPDNLQEPQPSLAESWDVSEDGRTFTFSIREGVSFHSGNQLTADDAAWSLQRLVKLGLAPSIDLRQWGFTAENVDSLIRATDDRTLVLETPEVWNEGLILASLGSFSASILDRKFLEAQAQNDDMGRDFLQTADAGSGPFTLRTWRANDVVMADAFEDYWQGAPQMRRVIMKHLPESASQRLQLEQGDVDVATRLSSTDLASLEQGDAATIQRVPGFGFYYLALNQQDEILSNPRVREAFRYLIDYDGLSSTVMQYYGTPQQTIVPAGLPGASDAMPYSLDLDRARELLAEAGYPDGFSKVYYATPVTPEYEIAQSIQSNAAKIGIKLDLQGGDHIGKFRERDFEVFSARSGERLPDPHAVLQSYATNPDNTDEARLGGLLAWRSAWNVPDEIQEKVVAAAHETDPERRAELYSQINAEYLESSPALITSFQRIDAKAVSARVEGYVGHPTWLTSWLNVAKSE